MSKKFCDLKFGRSWPGSPDLSFDHYCIGEERIYLHLYNEKKMHWYLAEYGPIGKRFFGFFVE